MECDYILTNKTRSNFKLNYDIVIGRGLVWVSNEPRDKSELLLYDLGHSLEKQYLINH